MMTRGRRWCGAALLALAVLATGGDAAAGPAWLAESYTVAHEETLPDIARRYDLGFTELRAANPGVDAWLPGAGTAIVLPTTHLLPGNLEPGITINLAEQRLYFMADTGVVHSMPIGIGRATWETPLGATRVVRLRENPTWVPPASIRAERPDLPPAIGPGPNNPLGSYAIDLAWPGYAIHGTNTPHGVGRRVSHGCIRLYPEDIAWLFRQVRIGTAVQVIDREAKLSWVDGELYLEVHANQAQGDAIEAGAVPSPAPIPEFDYQVLAAAGDQADRLNWPVARQAAEERRGLPVRITR